MTKDASLPTALMTTLPNGLRVVTQKISAMQSAAIGIRIDSSTRNEADDCGGASHFIEHLLFKGTEKRTADRIMEDFNALGARANAYTSQEEVFYYATSLASTIPATFEILADMFVNSTLPEEEVEKERGVVLQEISMNHDNPTRFVYHQFHKGFWKDHPIGKPILGTAVSITSIPRDRLMQHKKENYLAKATIVSAAGNVEHDEIVALADRLLSGLGTGELPRIAPGSTWSNALAENIHYQRPMEQTQFYMGYTIPPAGSEQRHLLTILNQILGGGMSSRLFREVRERRSLAYSVYSQAASYSDTAGLLIYAGTSADRAQEAIDVCHGEVRRFCNEMIDADTINAAKEQIRCKRLMALDDCETQVRRLSNTTSLFGAPEQVADSLEAVAAVTADEIIAMAKSLFSDAVPRVESIGPGDGPGLPN
ncbi:M16 family metallopeptidase [Pelotalea chapellei]|uniref:Insulinase family protein n=1 Tax=Pelotalea chapellei TaxID=44671 RepID=A0ABS5U3Q7_9BACT|nr:pitrilysin family protein [Pelotalea chapellei]MBT1070298.1 insulinase family protein [Pelotalea chapellei]